MVICNTFPELIYWLYKNENNIIKLYNTDTELEKYCNTNWDQTKPRKVLPDRV